MNILVTGASGFIGSSVVSRFSLLGHQVVPLCRGSNTGREPGPTWNPELGQIRLNGTLPIDCVLHLAGESIAQRWTPAAKARIRSSRVDATRLLCEALARLPQPPRLLVCASATGYYGDRGEQCLDESSSPGTGFLPEICQAWETASESARTLGARVVRLRLGIVLASHGGALAKMLPPFRLGLGGRLGSGCQYWSWITLEDLLRIIEFVMQDERIDGAVNAVSPEASTNAQFTVALARALHRPAILPVPAFAVKWIFGEMGREALLASARVLPARLQQNGFVFRFPKLELAFRESPGRP